MIMRGNFKEIASHFLFIRLVFIALPALYYIFVGNFKERTMKHTLITLLLCLFMTISATATEYSLPHLQEDTTETALLAIDTIATEAWVVDSIVPPIAIEQLGDTPIVVITNAERIFRNQYFQMFYVGVPMIAIGFATQHYVSEQFKMLHDNYTPDFYYRYDDYLQYAPGVAAIIIKACGVKGRSSWPRFLVSSVFSAALTAGLANGLKYTVGTLRPDGSTYNSFPSGHTATAFAAAHILHKEFGAYSPWISIGGYTVASVVGISRMLNNRHWIADVIAGAGIGILSTELGYFFADLIFKEKGLYDINYPDFSIPLCPSNAGLTMGLTFPLANIELGNGERLIPITGSRMGVEGTWFVNPYLGIGASASVATSPATLESRPDEVIAINPATVAAGLYGSIPMGDNSRFRASVKAFAGCNFMNNTQLIPDVLYTDLAGFYYELGASISFVARRHFGASIFCDFGGHFFTGHHTPSTEYGLSRSGSYNYALHTATVGLSTSVLF